MSSSMLQIFPALDSRTEAALRASIERFGVLVPVVHDQNGRILDGHHRSRIASSLGVPFDVAVRDVRDDEEAQEIARTLNADRRHLTAKQRRPVVAALREEGHSLRAIGGALGVSQTQVANDLAGVNPLTPERVEGQDGKSYPATQPKPEPPPQSSGRGQRNHQDSVYVAETKRQKELANGQKQRLIDGLSEITGICKGLSGLDYGMAVGACEDGERAVWTQKAGDLAKALRGIQKNLTEVK